MSGRDEQCAVIDMITQGNARALAISDYGLAVGNAANLVVMDARDEFDLLRLLPAAVWVIRNGRVIAESAPAKTLIHGPDGAQVIDFEAPQ
jgi:cytosine deaminase